MEIPKGVIPPKVPRPLTDDEAQALSDAKAEALAAGGGLDALRAKYGKPGHDRQRAATKASMKHPTSSLYTKDEE